ncbi:hypothetical protein CB0940_03057 [Cercospora beticola]|uniref:Centromere protein X n=1 Tax=Cercospora beticola TaxID=122368 RepID=A0A2G5I6S9_CERBT|nr:hypothetical protein CB0940_03057 [Cercospora beticola]PIB00183.1 hypothetical protein CB0940_03057 [Cercospora beticola]WPB00224.1 hypothetical protein RHO25_004843 [Cercospora beticola]CAK1361582.1 unnamed protein product [Cercospora beticola]
MPPRKEPKEQVVYPSSKAKTPAFKPLRPTKIGRTSTTESESAVPKPKPTAKKAGPSTSRPNPASKARPKITVLPDSEDDDDENVNGSAKGGAANDTDEDDESLPSLSTTATNLNKTTAKRKASAISIDSTNDVDQPQPSTTTARATTSTNDDFPPALSSSDGIPSIPQPLLLRLLHSGFTHQDTQIDTQALQIVQTYLDVFVRETIARCVAEKKEAAERGEVEESDVGWLELEDLEKVGVGMMLDF